MAEIPDIEIGSGDMKSLKDAEQQKKEDSLRAAVIRGLKMGNSAFSEIKSVKRAVKALKKIQFDHVNLEVEFFQELHELEMKYEKFFAPLYAKRRSIVSGAVIPTDEECEFQSDSDKESDISGELQKLKIEPGDGRGDVTEDMKDVKGVPEFWLLTFRNVPTISEMIEEYDEPILKYLLDVRAISSTNPMSFDLEFHFESNEYFSNTLLTKHYELRCLPDPSDVFSFEGPEIISCKGCTIEWKKGKNVTVKTIKKKQKHKAKGQIRTVTKTVQNDSFFNFFDPPTVPESEEQLDSVQAILNADFELGNLIKERVVPNAVLFYTGDLISEEDLDEDEDDFDDDDDDEDDDEEDEEEDEADNSTYLSRKKPTGKNKNNTTIVPQAPSECKQQ